MLKRKAAQGRAGAASAQAQALKVSVVVPAYNDERFIGRAVASCLAQTHANVEVICVDDGSTDGTPDVLRSLAECAEGAPVASAAKAAKGDSRVKVITLPENGGTHNARRAGLREATGELVMFLDGDDELAAPTCARAAAEYARKPFDILHFASRVKRDGKVSAERVRTLTNWMRPVKGELHGRDILEASFARHEYSFSVACKAYPLALVKQALDQIGDVRADSGEDALEYFAIAANADTYRGLPQCRYYVYHLGDGLSERQGMTAHDFNRVLRLHDAVQAIDDLLQRSGKMQAYADIFQAHWRDQLEVTLRACLNDVRPQDRALCLRRVLEEWPPADVADATCRMGSLAVEELLQAAPDGLQLTDEQLIACGRADGERAVREEYETSLSYRVGRAITAPARKVRR